MKAVSTGEVIAVEDILTRHRSTGEPVRALLSEMARKRRLGMRERLIVADEVFGALRQKAWPEWFQKRLQKQYGSAAEALEKALRVRARPVIAVDPAQMSLEEAAKQLRLLGIESLRSELSNTALILASDRANLSELKACWWMDEGSQYIAEQVQAKGGERVLDLCAGAGGKTRLLKATGAHITAVDISERRLARLENVRRIVADGRTLKQPPFDWILVDSPCSGTGTLRHAPDLFGRLSESDLAGYQTLQAELVANATQLLRPSGRLIYATCSVLTEENQKSFPGLKLMKSRQLLPHIDNCDGFYVGIFELS